MTAEQSPSTPTPSFANSTSPATKSGATLGPKTRIQGELTADEDLLIEGSFTGTLKLKDNQLSIGAQGKLSGTAFASVIIVDGNVDGDLYASERLAIRKGAKVKGSILSPRVSLEDGANLCGSVEMDPQAIKEAIQAEFGASTASSTPASNNANAPQGNASANNTANNGASNANKGNDSKPNMDKKPSGPQFATAAK